MKPILTVRQCDSSFAFLVYANVSPFSSGRCCGPCVRTIKLNMIMFVVFYDLVFFLCHLHLPPGWGLHVPSGYPASSHSVKICIRASVNWVKLVFGEAANPSPHDPL